ncbi:DUF3489 domain-containing protein [Lysobacter sp. CA199]|uniref:DUF3489 domain-containing protein n=1 Tax=Lysobacter sp. CA199 TaxID=3455608 RepID=UPI003F8D6A44
MTQLTDNQRALILLAVETEGRIENFPDNLKGGARSAVTRGLLVHGLVESQGTGYALTEAGYEAVGAKPHAARHVHDEEREGSDEVDTGAEANADDQNQNAGDVDNEADAEGDDDEEDNEAVVTAKPTAPPKQRKETRIDQVIALLLRPEGATIPQVMAVTDWQQHSVRGFFAGTLKKKGYELISVKSGKEDRIYRIKAEEAVVAEVASDEEE